eukprot:TRINITY_DN66507_c0_g1_i1.p1 TRINITY_DN66507_c0_g1~~TRINITY_DN66507_c0_g1_i1.p1  ORF type:complete len:139 (+),score=22.11 TRINITY_DN66507_c0_g1_i1:30-446(+)
MVLEVLAGGAGLLQLASSGDASLVTTLIPWSLGDPLVDSSPEVVPDNVAEAPDGALREYVEHYRGIDSLEHLADLFEPATAVTEESSVAGSLLMAWAPEGLRAAACEIVEDVFRVRLMDCETCEGREGEGESTESRSR